MCLLKTTIHDIYSPDVARQVRVLVDSVEDKLHTHCPGEAKEGSQDLEGILEGLLEEFRWGTIAEILQLALDEAREQKELAYRKAESYDKKLRNLRQRCSDPSQVAVDSAPWRQI